MLTVDKSTGVVHIINPKPAGEYTVYVKSEASVKSFTLSVTDPNCSSEYLLQRLTLSTYFPPPYVSTIANTDPVYKCIYSMRASIKDAFKFPNYGLNQNNLSYI